LLGDARHVFAHCQTLHAQELVHIEVAARMCQRLVVCLNTGDFRILRNQLILQALNLGFLVFDLRVQAIVEVVDILQAVRVLLVLANLVEQQFQQVNTAQTLKLFLGAVLRFRCVFLSSYCSDYCNRYQNGTS
jgi:hypothetical protein